MDCLPRHDLVGLPASDAQRRCTMTAPRSLVLAALLLTGAAPAPIRIMIRNATSAPMACQILAAHWYTPLPVATAQPGEDATLALSFDAARGEAVDDPVRKLPLETLFCGRVGQAWETRDALDLRALAARAASAGVARAACVDAGDALRCTAAP
jgi:hypothetical protein